MTTDEARKFFDELPKFVDVPTGDGSGDIVKVHKSHPMRDDVNRIIADLERQATAAQEETENLALLRAEALRRGCKPDQPIGEAFPEGLRVALAKLRGVAVQ
jgi:hypothetical protein